MVEVKLFGFNIGELNDIGIIKKNVIRVYFISCKNLLQIATKATNDAVKFTSEMHDPCARTVTYKREENKNTLQKAPVWSRPNTLRKLSQKYSYNSRVLERGQLCVP